MSKRLIFALLVLVAGAQGVLADETRVGDLVVKQAWARATIGLGKTGAMYLTVTNRGDKADRLIAVTTPIARRAGLHTHIVDGDVIKMRPVEAVEIAAGQSATFKPGGDHIMMMGLKRPLKKGGSFPLTLTFEAAGSVAIMVDIAGATAKSHNHGKQD
jgi:periplasmic copper chaperone A